MSVNLKELPHSMAGDIGCRPVSPNYNVHTRDLTA
jgi:hypothetical protein